MGRIWNLIPRQIEFNVPVDPSIRQAQSRMGWVLSVHPSMKESRTYTRNDGARLYGARPERTCCQMPTVPFITDRELAQVLDVFHLVTEVDNALTPKNAKGDKYTALQP